MALMFCLIVQFVWRQINGTTWFRLSRVLCHGAEKKDKHPLTESRGGGGGRFTFSHSKDSSNGTSVTGGQFLAFSFS